MSQNIAIVGMWGTTNLNLFLLQEQDGKIEIRDQRKGPGASKLAKDAFEDTLFDLAGDWLDLDIRPGIVLAGMVGSTIGWVEAGYTSCPTRVFDVEFAPALWVRGKDIRILSGLICTNPRGDVDVMRGEETELIGLMKLLPELLQGEHLVCIPGTHAKWIKIRDGVVIEFSTSVAGEMFAGLKANGVLVDPELIEVSEVDNHFLAGANLSLNDPELLLHSLFGVRARQVTGYDNAESALQRLSGLIIGNDVAAALKNYAPIDTPVIVIGSDKTASRYAAALELAETQTLTIPAERASAAGLWEMSSLTDFKGSNA